MSIKYAGPRCCLGDFPCVYKLAPASKPLGEHVVKNFGVHQPRSYVQMYFSEPPGNPKNNSIYVFSRDLLPNPL